MKNGDIRLRIDHSKMTATVAPIAAEAVERAANVMADRVRGNIAQDNLVNSGRLLASIETADAPSAPLFPRKAIGSPLDYVKYPEYGTRAHGPVKANALKFMPKGGKAFVFATWVRGVRPYGFMQRSLDHIRMISSSTTRVRLVAYLL